MKRIADVLFDPIHLQIILPLVIFNIFFDLIDLFNIAEIRFDFLSYLLSIAYFVSVVHVLIRGGSLRTGR